MENLKVFENDINRLTYFESDDYVNPHVSCLEDGSKVMFCNGVTITAKASAATTLPIIYKGSSTFDKPDKTVLLKANEVTTVTIERPYIYSTGLYTEGLTLGGVDDGGNTAVTEIAIDGILMSPENAFRGCSGLTSIDLTKTNTDVIDTSIRQNTNYMFYQCFGLTSLDLSNFNTSRVVNMICMFDYCSNLTFLDLSNFDTDHVQSMNSMFDGCTKLNSINLSSFNTSNVTDMSAMFWGCYELTSLDLSNFNTSSVEVMSNMFRTCKGLASLNLGTFDMGKVTTSTNMFKDINPKVEITLAADSPSLTKIQTQLITDGVTGAKIHFNGKTYYYDTTTTSWKGITSGNG